MTTRTDGISGDALGLLTHPVPRHDIIHAKAGTGRRSATVVRMPVWRAVASSEPRGRLETTDWSPQRTALLERSERGREAVTAALLAGRQLHQLLPSRRSTTQQPRTCGPAERQ